MDFLGTQESSQSNIGDIFLHCTLLFPEFNNIFFASPLLLMGEYQPMISEEKKYEKEKSVKRKRKYFEIALL
jgi:hypothetical protein